MAEFGYDFVGQQRRFGERAMEGLRGQLEAAQALDTLRGQREDKAMSMQKAYFERLAKMQELAQKQAFNQERLGQGERGLQLQQQRAVLEHMQRSRADRARATTDRARLEMERMRGGVAMDDRAQDLLYKERQFGETLRHNQVAEETARMQAEAYRRQTEGRSGGTRPGMDPEEMKLRYLQALGRVPGEVGDRALAEMARLALPAPQEEYDPAHYTRRVPLIGAPIDLARYLKRGLGY